MSGKSPVYFIVRETSALLQNLTYKAKYLPLNLIYIPVPPPEVNSINVYLFFFLKHKQLGFLGSCPLLLSLSFSPRLHPL